MVSIANYSNAVVELGKRPLRPHQFRACRFIAALNGQAGVFMAPGTGKTLVAIRYGGHDRPGLIVCRRDDYMTWRDELTAEGYGYIVEIESGDSPLPSALDMAFCPWVIVTYDLCKHPRIAAWIKSIMFGICIADEAQQIKHWESDRTKAVIRCTRHIPKRLALTGSPITNEPEDLYSICLFIDDGRTFGNNLYKFKHKYYLKSGYGWYRRQNAKELIAPKLAQIAFYVHEDDVLKLPPIRHLTKAVPMSGMQRKHYERVLHDWEVELDNGELMEIDHVIVQITKLKQIASGFMYKPDKTTMRLRSTKLDLMREVLKDPDMAGGKEKVVLWGSYTEELRMMGEMAQQEGWGHVLFHGSDRKDKEAARVRFRDDPTCRLFIGNVDAGVGMNELIVADTAMYFSNSTKVASRQQSMRRNRRIGSERHKVITYWDFLSEGSLDSHVLKSVRSSMSLATHILNAIKQGQHIRAILN